jgi:hypothetical protein
MDAEGNFDCWQDRETPRMRGADNAPDFLGPGTDHIERFRAQFRSLYCALLNW